MIEIKQNTKHKPLHIFLLSLFIIFYILSAIKPLSYSIWFFESLPAFVGVALLVFTYNKFMFTDFIYILILILTTIMLFGAHYKYSQVPLFNLLKQVYNLKRNYYDRFGHFMQGFVPAFILRELLIRKLKLKKGTILSIIVVCICLSISAFYEISEGISCIIYGETPENFLEFQGDNLDTQWDMFCAFVGSILSVSIFHKFHDKSMCKLKNKKDNIF